MTAILPYSPNDPQYFQLLREWFRSKQAEDSKSSGSAACPSICELFRFSSGPRPRDIPPDHWTHIRYTIYVFLAILWPADALIPELPLDTPSGGVFHAITHLLLLRSNSVSPNNTLLECFEGVVAQLFAQKRADLPLYHLGPALYMHNVPKLLSCMLPEDRSSRLFFGVIDSFTSNDVRGWTDCELCFLSEVLRCFLSSKQGRVEQYKNFFMKLFRNDGLSIRSRVQYFFPQWRTLIAQTIPHFDSDQSQARQLSELFERLSRWKYHDLPGGFQWHFCFQLYESLKDMQCRMNVMYFICRIASSLQRVDVMNRLDSLATPFMHVLRFQWNQKDHCYLGHFLTSSISMISSLNANIAKVRGIELKHDRHRCVAFADQPRERRTVMEIDSELVTKFDSVSFDSFREAQLFFDDEWRHVELIAKKLTYTFNFTLVGPLSIHELIDGRSSALSIYLQSVIQVWVRFLLLYTHRVTMLQYFLFHSYATFTALQRSPFLARRSLDLASVHTRFADALIVLPAKFADLVADAVVYELAKGVRDGIMNYQFASGFLARLMYVPQFSEPLLAKMTFMGIRFLDRLTYPMYSDSLFVNQWFLLMIRMGTPPAHIESNFYFGGILSQFQNLFFCNIAMNIRRNSAQKLALSTFNWLRKARARNRTFTLEDQTKSAVPMRRYPYEDIHMWARKDAIPIHLDTTIRDPSTIGLSAVSHFITPGLRSHSSEIYRPAVDIFLDLINKETKARAMIAESDALSALYDAYFDVMRRDDPDYSIKILRTVPMLTGSFLHSASPKKDSPGYPWQNFGVSLDRLLAGVAAGITDTPAEAPFVLLLCKTSFEVIKENFVPDNNRMGIPIDTSLKLLASLLKFEIKPAIMGYFKELNHWFAEHTSHRWKNCYFMSLLSAAGSCRGASAGDLSDLAVDLVRECLRLETPVAAMSQCVMDLFQLTTPQLYHCVFVLGMYLVGSFFPDALTYEHFSLLLTYCCHHFQRDPRVNDLIAKVVEMYFNKANDTEKMNLVELLYERLPRLPGSFRLPLLLAASEFKIPLNLPSFQFIAELDDVEQFLGRLTVAFAFGIVGDTKIPLLIRERITHMIPEPQRANQTIMERFSRMIVLCYIILRIPRIAAFFLESEEFIRRLTNLMLATCTDRFPMIRPAAKQCFRCWVTLHFQNPKVSQPILKVFDSRPPQCLDTWDRQFLYHQLIKIQPSQCAPESTRAFLTSIFEYCEHPPLEKVKWLRLFILHLKHLGIKDFITQQKAYEICLMKSDPNKDTSYLEEFIIKMVALYQTKEIPFLSLTLKLCRKFLIIFPAETVTFILGDLHDQEFSEASAHDARLILGAQDFLQLLIENDVTDTFLRVLCNQLSEFRGVLRRFHPGIFRLLKRIVSQPRFVKLDFLVTFIVSLFTRVTQQHSLLGTAQDHNIYMNTMHVARSYLQILEHSPSPDHFACFAELFTIQPFMRSSIYSKFKRVLVGDGSSSRLVPFFIFFVNHLTANGPIRVVADFLSRILKSMNELPIAFEDRVWEIAQDFLKKETVSRDYFVMAVLIITRLVGRENPNRKFFPMVIDLLPRLFQEGEVLLVMKAFKLTISLLSYDALSIEAFQQILTHILLTGKLLDGPYNSLVLRMLKMRPEMTVPKTPEFIEAIYFFVIDTFPHLLALPRLVLVFQNAPEMAAVLPFSILRALTHSLNIKMNQKTEHPQRSDIENGFLCGLKISLSIHPSKDELDEFLHACFLRLNTLFESETRIREFCDSMCPLLMKIDYSCFHEDVLVTLSQRGIVDKSEFELVAFALKSLPASTIMKYKEYVTKCIESMLSVALVPAFINLFLVGILRTEALWFEFEGPLRHILLTLKQHQTDHHVDFTLQILQICTKTAVSVDHLDVFAFLTELWKFAPELESAVHVKQVYRTGLILFDELGPSLHRGYLDLILSTISMNDSLSKSFLEVIHIFFECSQIIRSVKTHVLTYIFEVLPINPSFPLDRLCEAIDSDLRAHSRIEMFSAIPVFVCHCMSTTPTPRLLVVDRILNILSKEPHERFLQLSSCLPLRFWHNRYLPFLSLLILGPRPGYRAVMSFIDALSDLGVDTFTQVIQTISPAVRSHVLVEFLMSLISLEVRDNDHAISVLLTFLQDKLDFPLLYRCSKLYNNLSLLLDWIPAAATKTNLALPHPLNDLIFGGQFETISNPAAAAQFFLGNYNEAAACFKSSIPTTEFEQRLHEITCKFVPGNSPNLFSVLRHPISSLLYEALTLVRRGGVNAALTQLEMCESANLALFRRRPVHTLFQRHQMFAIEASISAMRQVIDNGMQTRFGISDYYDFYCTLPVFRDMLDHLRSDLIPNFHRSIPMIVQAGDPLPMVFPGDLHAIFNRVSGYTPHGLVQIDCRELERFLGEFQVSSKVSALGEHRWASLCFQVFCVSPTSILMGITLSAYGRILQMHESHHLFVRHEASARIITLLRLANRLETNCVNECSSFVGIIGTQSNPLGFWMFQLNELARESWFRTPVPWLCDVNYYAARYSMSGMNYDTFRQSEVTSRTLAVFEELKFIDVLERFLDFVFSEPFDRFQEQQRIERILREPKADFRAIRKRPPRNQFETIVGLLSLYAVDRLVELHGSAVDTVIPNSVPFSEMEAQFHEHCRNVNNFCHFPIPCRAQALLPQHLISLRHDVLRVGTGLYCLHFTTTLPQRYICRVSRVGNPISRSFASVVHVLKHILNFSYPCRSRLIKLSCSLEFRIGSRYYVAQVPPQTTTLEHYFELATDMQVSQWLEQPSDVPEAFVRDQFMKGASKDSYFKMRMNFLKTTASASFVKELFAAKYPALNEYFLSQFSADTSFDCEGMSILGDQPASHFRLSPNLLNFIGNGWLGEMTIAMAAIGHSIMQHIDGFRAVLEVLIGDWKQRVFDVDAMMHYREIIEAPLFMLAPPAGPGSTAEDSEAWIANVSDVIKKATNPANQPVLCVPWF
jgi:hypothetical protein